MKVPSFSDRSIHHSGSWWIGRYVRIGRLTVQYLGLKDGKPCYKLA
jgi:hypothetical protein